MNQYVYSLRELCPSDDSVSLAPVIPDLRKLFLHVKNAVGKYDPNPFREFSCIHYCVSHGNLHGWMLSSFYDRISESPVYANTMFDSWTLLEITNDDLDALEDSVNSDVVHSENVGFHVDERFLIPSWTMNDSVMINNARFYIAQGRRVYYRCVADHDDFLRKVLHLPDRPSLLDSNMATVDQKMEVDVSP